MTNNVNYINHSTFEPDYYQRRFDHDIPEATPDWMETGKRACLIALPFLSLNKSFGKGISLVMGSVRCISDLFEIIQAKDFIHSIAKVAKLAISILALAGALFSFQLGLCISTLADIGLGLIHAIQHLASGNWNEAMEELVQTLSSLLYLTIILTGSLEVILLSILVQAILNLYQSISEYKKGRWPECIAKLVMGMIRFNQADHYVSLIKRRDLLLSIEKFAQLSERIKKGREAAHLINSPLDKRESEVILLDAQGKPYNFGSQFHGNGKGSVKGMNLQFRTHYVDGKNKTQLDFKVNHVFRDRLASLLKELESFDAKELKEFLDLTHSHAKNIKIEQLPFKFSEDAQPYGSVCKVHLEGLGSISIGNDTSFPNLYDRVTVEIDEDKSLYELHELLSFFNLDDTLKVSSDEDIERLKVGQLFRMFHPKEATLLEREESFFTLPLEDLKALISSKVPEMQKTLAEYLPKMEAREILPGRMRYALPGLADKLYDLGARGLVSTITGPQNEVYDRAASAIKMGMLAAEMRYSNGMSVHGLGPTIDFIYGGADSVFTQLLTDRNIAEKINLDANLYPGNIRFLISLDMLETSTYQYDSGLCGTRMLFTDNWWEPMLEKLREENISFTLDAEMVESLRDFRPYKDRQNIEEFIKYEKEAGFSLGHEVMVKERIPPQFITGIFVPDMETRDLLVENFRTRGVIANLDGVETILNKPVDRFIHVGTELSEAFFA